MSLRDSTKGYSCFGTPVRRETFIRKSTHKSSSRAPLQLYRPAEIFSNKYLTFLSWTALCLILSQFYCLCLLTVSPICSLYLYGKWFLQITFFNSSIPFIFSLNTCRFDTCFFDFIRHRFPYLYIGIFSSNKTNWD